jgi:chorismate mutase
LERAQQKEAECDRELIAAVEERGRLSEAVGEARRQSDRAESRQRAYESRVDELKKGAAMRVEVERAAEAYAQALERVSAALDSRSEALDRSAATLGDHQAALVRWGNDLASFSRAN